MGELCGKEGDIPRINHHRTLLKDRRIKSSTLTSVSPPNISTDRCISLDIRSQRTGEMDYVQQPMKFILTLSTKDYSSREEM